jgi:hypothetical protein
MSTDVSSNPSMEAPEVTAADCYMADVKHVVVPS